MTHKTLIISYLPRGELSKTKQLLDAVIARIGVNPSSVTAHEFSAEIMPYMNAQNIDTYYHRWEHPETISEEALANYRPFEQYAEEVIDNDTIVIAYPVYNWGAPAPIKAWIDAVMQARRMPGADSLPRKRIICVMTSGGQPNEEFPSTVSVFSYIEEVFQKILGCANVHTLYIS